MEVTLPCSQKDSDGYQTDILSPSVCYPFAIPSFCNPLFFSPLTSGKIRYNSRFLQYVIGFDSVDDESKPENPMFDETVPTPDEVK